MDRQRLPHSVLLELKRWNTPTIYNGWEYLTKHDAGTRASTRRSRALYAPDGPDGRLCRHPAGGAGQHRAPAKNPSGWAEYRRYVASIPGPKIVVVQDLDKPATYGSFWGEVNSNAHRALGCVGTITDGAIRDLDEMTNAGFKALARRMCVGHAFGTPVRWDCEVEVFGRVVRPGQLIHADKHGFLVVPEEDEAGLLEAARFMDSNECNTVIVAARSATGRSPEESCRCSMRPAASSGGSPRKFRSKGEW